VVAAEIHVHQPRDELIAGRVLVVLDALEQGVGAVPDADDRDADLVVRAARLTVGRSHGFLSCEPLGERLDDQVVDVPPALPRAGRELVLQLRGHAQEHRAARAGRLPRAAAGVEGDSEAGGEQTDRDVIEAAAGALDLLREKPLELARHPDEHVLAGGRC
jgi:hypothetical protein